MVSVTTFALCILGMPVATSRGLPITQVSPEPSGSVTATGVERLELEAYICCVFVLCVHVSEYVKKVDNGTIVGSLDGLE